jgi:carbohydrate-selective porin OprB
MNLNRMVFLGVFFFLGAMLFFARPTMAQDAGITREEFTKLLQTTEALKQKVHELETKLETYEKVRPERPEAANAYTELKAEVEELKHVKEALSHIELSGGATAVLQTTANNDHNNPEEGDSTDGAYTLDLNIATHFGSYGSFYVHLESGDGEGVNDDVPSFSIPNYDSYVTRLSNNQCGLTVSEAFYEFSFLDEMFLFDVGKMDVSVLFDENEVAGDETTQFLSNIFVKSMGLTVPEPDNFYAPAMMLTVSPVDLVEFKLIGASVEDDNWEDVFDHGFLAGQINLRPKVYDRQGNYRFYAWWDDRSHLGNKHLEPVNSRAGGYGDSLADEDQMGWGLSFDQEVTDGVKAFVRYSQTEDDLARWDSDEDEWAMIPFDRTWSAGLGVSGLFWNRENDDVGVAYGRVLLTNDYEDANEDTADERYVEAYYNLGLHERFHITGDFQWIQNAGGDSDASDVYIFGLRSQLSF